MSDANGNVTSYAYDGLDRLEEAGYGNAAIDPASDCFTGTPANECFAYDGNANVTQHQTRALDEIDFAFDDLNRLAENIDLACDRSGLCRGVIMGVHGSQSRSDGTDKRCCDR